MWWPAPKCIILRAGSMEVEGKGVNTGSGRGLRGRTAAGRRASPCVPPLQQQQPPLFLQATDGCPPSEPAHGPTLGPEGMLFTRRLPLIVCVRGCAWVCVGVRGWVSSTSHGPSAAGAGATFKLTVPLPWRRPALLTQYPASSPAPPHGWDVFACCAASAPNHVLPAPRCPPSLPFRAPVPPLIRHENLSRFVCNPFCCPRMGRRDLSARSAFCEALD